MITRFWTGTRKDGTSRAQFQQHWYGTHAAFGLALPGLRAYVQNHVLGTVDVVTVGPVFDGCSELSFDDVAAMRAAFASPAMAAADEDEGRFADPDRFAVVVTEREVLSGAEPKDPGYRLLSFMRTNSRRSRADLAGTLRGDYADLARSSGAACHELYVAVDEPGEPQACDVVDSLWFVSREAAVVALRRLGDEAGAVLAGAVFGREVALVQPRRLRP